MTTLHLLMDLRERRKAARIPQHAVADAMKARGHRWTTNLVSLKETGKRGTWLHEYVDWLDVLDQLVKAR